MGIYDLVTKRKERRRTSGQVKKDSASSEVSISSAQENKGSDRSKAGASNDVELVSVSSTNAVLPMKEKPSTIEINEPAQWVERMALTSTRPLPPDLSADDDPKREEAFIQQTLLSVVQGIALLERSGVVWKRPDDYYAEMYKSDVHMNNVRRAMEATKARIEAQAQRRAMKDQKKFGKEVQAEVLRHRAKYKRDMQERLSSWRKKKRNDDAMRDFLNSDNDNAEALSKNYHTGPRQRNLRPGGKSKRLGKNARRRR